MYKIIIFLVAINLLLQACTGSSVKPQQQASVTSSPVGASVYADDKALGVTPLMYDLYDAFPAGWANSSYQAQGVLAIRKSGCEDFTLKVSDYILSKPVHADLKCVEVSNEQKMADVKLPPSTIEKRLNELKDLYDKSVITKDEYGVARKRILDEL